jgi:hypothetical protein
LIWSESFQGEQVIRAEVLECQGTRTLAVSAGPWAHCLSSGELPWGYTGERVVETPAECANTHPWEFTDTGAMPTVLGPTEVPLSYPVEGGRMTGTLTVLTVRRLEWTGTTYSWDYTWAFYSMGP